jgi:hypothetical protein
MSDVTRILSAIERGDPHAAEQLLPLVYDELRKLATARLAQENPGQTLQATALVHEAYLRLVDVEKAQEWNSRGHFFAAAATSSLPRPRPCPASLSRTPARSTAANAAAPWSASTPIRPNEPRGVETTWDATPRLSLP